MTMQSKPGSLSNRWLGHSLLMSLVLMSLPGCISYSGCNEACFERRRTAAEKYEAEAARRAMQHSYVGNLARHFYSDGLQSATGDRPLPPKLQASVAKLVNRVLGAFERGVDTDRLRRENDAPADQISLTVKAALVATGINRLAGRPERRVYRIEVDQRVIEAMLRSSIVDFVRSDGVGMNRPNADEATAVATFLGLESERNGDAVIWSIAFVERKFMSVLWFALAHEYGHYALNHAGRLEKTEKECQDYQELEAEADFLAGYLAFAAARQGLLADNPAAALWSMGTGQPTELSSDGAFFRTMIGSGTFLEDSFRVAQISQDATCEYPSSEDRVRIVELAYGEATKMVSNKIDSQLADDMRAMCAAGVQHDQCPKEGIKESDLTPAQRKYAQCMQRCAGKMSCECSYTP